MTPARSVGVKTLLIKQKPFREKALSLIFLTSTSTFINNLRAGVDKKPMNTQKLTRNFDTWHKEIEKITAGAQQGA